MTTYYSVICEGICYYTSTVLASAQTDMNSRVDTEVTNLTNTGRFTTVEKLVDGGNMNAFVRSTRTNQRTIDFTTVTNTQQRIQKKYGIQSATD